MQIPINTEVLKSVHAKTEDEARLIIDQTNRVRINDNTLIEPKRQKDGFTVRAPPNLDDGLLFIDLIDVHGAPVAALAYDLKAEEFLRQRVPDPERAPSHPTNPQADPGRDLELALQIGNKAALIVFLDYHPEGLHADLARAKLKEMP